MSEPILRPHIIDRVVARRGRLRWFDALDPRTTALVVIDMQDTFCAPGSPAEVAGSRDIVEPINACARGLRALGGQVIWVLHANSHVGLRSDWELFFNHVVSEEVRARTIESLTPGRQKTWGELEQDSRDLTVFKNRYSALISGSSGLERTLRSLGVDTLLIAGTKTNVCCESTARDAMMLDFKTVMLSDCCAALSFEEHRATLETFVQQFGDVLTAREALDVLGAGAR
ncbi:MAG: isochorismatase hydrolase [Hyphomicrobiales bacterium]|nr:isochorismatase hydrolase [Hyphomicrobiales bacterium]